MITSLAMRIGSHASSARTANSGELLVVQARRGDHRAFEALVRKHKDSAFNVARRIVSDPDAAEDVTQEAFIKAYRQLPRFRGAASFSTWLYSIVVNEARMYLRAARRRQARSERQADAGTNQANGAQGREQADALVALLQELPEKQRAALALFYLQELSVDEIAATIGTRAGTVKSWLSRGRERLRKLAAERGLL